MENDIIVSQLKILARIKTGKDLNSVKIGSVYLISQKHLLDSGGMENEWLMYTESPTEEESWNKFMEH